MHLVHRSRTVFVLKSYLRHQSSNLYLQAQGLLVLVPFFLCWGHDTTATIYLIYCGVILFVFAVLEVFVPI